MGSIAQRFALQRFRTRLAERGLVRFEVIGLKGDRELLRAVARRLADADADSARVRAEVQKAIAADQPPRRGGILAAFRRSPLVGANLNLKRDRPADRKVDL